MSALPSESIAAISSEELNNIAINIEQKLKLLGIKLPKLAELAEVDYFTLRKIINRENEYMPNLRILIKLAAFFNIATGDLLNFNNLPQYVPIINIEQIENFLENEISEFELQDTVFSDSYIHEYAFSVKRQLSNFNIKTMVDHVCYPTNKFYKDGIFIVKLNNRTCFIQVHTIKNNIIYFTDGNLQNLQNEDIKNVIPIAVVIKFILNQNLI